MLRQNRIKDYIFPIGSLVASSAGLFDVQTDHVLNGVIQSVTLYGNNYTTTGSILLFSSGLHNSGTALGGLIITLRAGSNNRDDYPVVYNTLNQSVISSGTTGPMFTQPVINSVLRVVGSGLGNTTSGLGLVVRYI